jgi:hypothetical protein
MQTVPFFLLLNYAKILGAKLDRFTVKRESSFLATARCPICLEGSSKTKRRFYIYEKDSSINVVCHNCGLSTTLISFLKNNFKQLFDEFIFEKLKISGYSSKVINDKYIPKVIKFVPEKIIRKVSLDLPLVSSLSEDHIAVKYIRNRKLPDYPFMFAEKFFEFSKQYNETLSVQKDEPRLIIPFFDKSGSVFAYQGRSFAAKPAQKYITITINDKIPKIFGIDKLDTAKPILLVEGPLDSLFLPNCLASVNASLVSTARKLIAGGINKSAITLIFDNESRSKTIVSMYESAIREGFNLVIWPRYCNNIKDINDMILQGLDPLSIISTNTYNGLSGQLQFNKWKKI